MNRRQTHVTHAVGLVFIAIFAGSALGAGQPLAIVGAVLAASWVVSSWQSALRAARLREQLDDVRASAREQLDEVRAAARGLEDAPQHMVIVGGPLDGAELEPPVCGCPSRHSVPARVQALSGDSYTRAGIDHVAYRMTYSPTPKGAHS